MNAPRKKAAAPFADWTDEQIDAELTAQRAQFDEMRNTIKRNILVLEAERTARARERLAGAKAGPGTVIA